MQEKYNVQISRAQLCEICADELAECESFLCGKCRAEVLPKEQLPMTQDTDDSESAEQPWYEEIIYEREVEK